MRFTANTDLNGPSPQFTLTCISTGGPATTVTWTRDSQEISEGNASVINDQIIAEYTHTLTVTGRSEGRYKCLVTNKNSGGQRQFDVLGKQALLCCAHIYHHKTYFPAPSPPSLSVSRRGENSVLVMWTKGEMDVTNYTIYYWTRDVEQKLLLTAMKKATNATINGLIVGTTYFISMVANSATFPSIETPAISFPMGRHFT